MVEQHSGLKCHMQGQPGTVKVIFEMDAQIAKIASAIQEFEMPKLELDISKIKSPASSYLV